MTQTRTSVISRRCPWAASILQRAAFVINSCIKSHSYTVEIASFTESVTILRALDMSKCRTFRSTWCHTQTKTICHSPLHWPCHKPRHISSFEIQYVGTIWAEKSVRYTANYLRMTWLQLEFTLLENQMQNSRSGFTGQTTNRVRSSIYLPESDTLSTRLDAMISFDMSSCAQSANLFPFPYMIFSTAPGSMHDKAQENTVETNVFRLTAANNTSNKLRICGCRRRT